jgi:glycosyltransferase involved in cell wall biosynthesis
VIKVSSITSVYKGGRFIVGRLEDLLAQTLYKRQELEIIVVVNDNADNEAQIVRDYQLKHDNIVFIRSLRESIYASWNRGVKIAKGEYITNANVDDRLSPYALEHLALELELDADIGLVYPDAIVTSTANATWGNPYTVSDKPPYYGKMNWPDYDPALLLQYCYMGPHPMWRKSLHDKYGLFDDSFQLAGDLEMWLRLASAGVNMLHLPQQLGLFYDDGSGINHAEFSAMESRRAVLKWQRIINARLANQNKS